MEQKENFHQKLQEKINTFVHLIYELTRKLPKEELYGITSQMRRAALSIALNYIEGFARLRDKVQINFLEISYGSLKETKYLLSFSTEERYFQESEIKKVNELAEEIGAMLWKTMAGLKQKIYNKNN